MKKEAVSIPAARAGMILVLMSAGALALTGCASSGEKTARMRYAEAETGRFELPGSRVTNSLSGAPEIDGKAGMEDYIRYAFLHNPGLAAAFSRWKAALEEIHQARSFDDPELAYEYSIDQKDFLQRFSVVQSVPGFGKLGWRGKKALYAAEEAAHDFEVRKLMVYGDVVMAFSEYNYLRRATEITENNLSLLTDLEKVVRTKYEAANAAFSDLIKVQVEQERMKTELAAMQDERGALSARLAALLGLPVKDVLPWPVFVSSDMGTLNYEGLMAMLKDLNPELKAMDAAVLEAEAELKLARRRWLPDFMLGAGLMTMPGHESGPDEVESSIMAGVSLPVWGGKNAAGVRQAEAMLEAALRERDNLENSLKAELKKFVSDASDSVRRIELFKSSVIPKAMQAYEAARQEFSSGRSDFMTLIDAQRTLLEFRLMYERALADAEIAMAEIGCCIGKYNLDQGSE